MSIVHFIKYGTYVKAGVDLRKMSSNIGRHRPVDVCAISHEHKAHTRRCASERFYYCTTRQIHDVVGSNQSRVQAIVTLFEEASHAGWSQAISPLVSSGKKGRPFCSRLFTK